MFLMYLLVMVEAAAEDVVKDGKVQGSCSGPAALNPLQVKSAVLLQGKTELHLGRFREDKPDSITAPQVIPDRVLSQEEIEAETRLLNRLAEAPQNETELEMILKTIADIERPGSKPALLSPAAVDGKVNIYVDGLTAVPVRRETTDSFTQETLYSYPIEDSAVNATHVFLDFGRSHRGEFVRDTHVLNSYEYGKVEHRWGRNPMSSFPDVVLGGAEKLLTLSHDGAWPTTSLDRARAEQASRWSVTNHLAKQMRRAKTLATFLFFLKSRIGVQLVKAAIDPNHIKKVEEFARQNRGRPESSLLQRERALLQKLAQQSSTSASAAPSSSSDNCLHFAARPDIQVTSAGAFVPLGRKLVTYKGTMVFSPIQQIDFTSGVSTFIHDASKGVLNIYMGASSFFQLSDPQELVQDPRLVVGPADGASFTLAEEGRVQDVAPSSLMYGLYHAAHRIPLDYSFLFSDPRELCPPDKFNRLAEEAQDLDLMVFQKAEQPSLSYQVRLMSHLLDVMDCGTTFLRATHQNGNGVGLLETMVWAHFLMELTPERRLQYVHDWSNE